MSHDVNTCILIVNLVYYFLYVCCHMYVTCKAHVCHMMYVLCSFFIPLFYIKINNLFNCLK